MSVLAGASGVSKYALRIRWDKPIEDADRLPTLKRLIEE